MKPLPALLRPHRLLSSIRWRTRLVLWLAAIVTGLVVVAFAKLADLALELFFRAQAAVGWSPLLLTPAIGMLTVWLTLRYSPGAQGSGIPQVIAAAHEAARGGPVKGLVSARIILGKISFGALALAGGFSAGREGPSVQIAASIMQLARRWLPHTRLLRSQDLILVGGAAGVAAAFNAPLAGIVFAVEEFGRRLESRTSGILMSTIILSGLVAIALVGNYSYFGHPRVTTGSQIVLQVVACGLVCGVLGGGFSRLLLWPQRARHLRIWTFRKQHPVLFAGGCGLLVAVIGCLGGGLSFGSGYSITSAIIAGQVSPPWHMPLTRYLATLVSYYSGIPGGIFAPSLAVGGALGGTLATWLGAPAETLTIVVLCMAGFLAAVTQSPITAAIIVMEMVDGHSMVISLMAVTLIARAVSASIGPELYQEFSKSMLRTTQNPS